MRVVAAPETELSAQILERLRSWSRSGLLADFCWWPSGATSSDSFTVIRFSNGASQEIQLAGALDGVNPDEVRLVGIYCAARDEQFRSEFGDIFRERVAQAMQVVAFQPGRPLRTAMIVAPAAIGQVAAPGLFRSEWDANILIAPEDRRSPDASNWLADTSAVLPAHAAHALVSVADLWVSNGIANTSVLDSVACTQRGDQAVVVVPVRAYSRFVDLGYLSDHFADEVFARVDDSWPVPNRDRFRRIDDPSLAIRTVTDAYLRKHAKALGLSEFDPKPEPRKKLGIIEALRWLWHETTRRLREYILRRPAELVQHKAEEVSNRIADTIEREWQSRTGEKLPFDIRRLCERGIEPQELGRMIDELDTPLVPATGPIGDVWEDLIDLHIGLLDGSEVPPEIRGRTLEIDDRRLVVSDPSLLVLDPLRQPPLDPDGARPRACDPKHFEELAEALAADSVVRTGQAISLRTHASSAAASPAAPEGSGVEEESTLAEDPGETEAPEPVATLNLEAEEPREPSPQMLWRDEHSDVPIWVIGEHIAGALREAELKATPPAPAEVDPPADPEPVDDTPTPLHRRGPIRVLRSIIGFGFKTVLLKLLKLLFKVLLVLLVGPVAFAGVCVVIWHFLWFPLNLVVQLLFVSAVGIGISYWLVTTAWRLIAEREAAQMLYDEKRLEAINMAMERNIRRSDMYRLRHRYDEYLEWAEILGWALHHPVVGQMTKRLGLREPIDAAFLPVAMTVAVGRTGERMGAMVEQGRRHTFEPGWLSGLFLAVAKATVEDIQRNEGTEFGEDVEPRQAFTREVGAGRDSDLAKLTQTMRAGKHRQLEDSIVTSRLLDLLDGWPIDAVTDGVEPIDGTELVDPQPLPPSAAWFTPSADLAEMAERLKPAIVRLTATEDLGRGGSAADLEPSDSRGGSADGAQSEAASSDSQSTAGTPRQVGVIDFLADLVNVREPVSFLQDHWVDPTRADQALVRACLPAPPVLESRQTRLQDLAGRARFYRPLRIQLHRIELADPVVPTDLNCFRNIPLSAEPETPRPTRELDELDDI